MFQWWVKLVANDKTEHWTEKTCYLNEYLFSWNHKYVATTGWRVGKLRVQKRIWGFIANLLNITHLILVSGLRHICHILETSYKPDQTFAGICNYFRRLALWMIPLFFSLPRPFQITGTHFLSARCLFHWFLVNPQLLYFPPRAFLVVERWWEDREVLGEAKRNKRTGQCEALSFGSCKNSTAPHSHHHTHRGPTHRKSIRDKEKLFGTLLLWNWYTPVLENCIIKLHEVKAKQLLSTYEPTTPRHWFMYSKGNI